MSTRRTGNSSVLRSQFNESTALKAINNFATTGITDGEQLLNDLRHSLSALNVESYVNSTNDTNNDNNNNNNTKGSADSKKAQATRVNSDNIAFLDRFQQYTRNLFTSAEELRTVIAVRVPEMKEEDNRGVIVQVALIKILDAFQTKLTGTGKGATSDDASSAAVGSTHSLCSMFTAKEYFAARREAEERIIGKSKEDAKSKKEGGDDGENDSETEGEKGKTAKPSADDNNDTNNNDDDKDKEGTKAPSAFYELYQIDRDVRVKMELSTMQILTSLRAIINSYEMNYKKLLQPRVVNESMVSERLERK